MKHTIGILSLLFFSISSFSDIIDKPFGYETIYQEGSPLSNFDGKVLTSVFPKNIYGNETSGFSFGAKIPAKQSQTISYEVKFDESFDFVKGGKLPGLCGGKNASGGIPANGTNGFSARIMWRTQGRLVSYVYHVNQKEIYGDDFQWSTSKGKNIFLKPGMWHRIEFTVTMNDLGKANGSIKGFFDGGDETWSPKKEERLQIRNIQIF